MFNNFLNKIVTEVKNLRFSLFIILLFFVGTILYLSFPVSIKYFGIIPERNSNPLYWYTILTFSFIHCGFSHFFRDSLFILLVGIIIEKKINQKSLIIATFLSIIISVLILSIMSEGDIPLVGANFIFYGYIGTLFALWFIQRDKFTLYERIISILLCILVLFVIYNFTLVLNKAYIASIVTSFFVIKYFLKKENINNN